MKLSFTTYQIGKNLDLDALLEMASASGCTGIEFRLESKDHGVEISCTEEERKVIRKKIEDKYLEVAGIGTGFRFQFTDPEERKTHIEGAKQACKLAYDLGCSRIRVFGNKIPEGVNAQDCSAWVAQSLAEVADYALPLGVDVLLEMHGHFNYWGYALPVIKMANRQNIGILYNCDDRDLVAGSVQETYERIAPYIRHIHLHGFHTTYPYLELFTLLLKDGYEGYASAEINGSPDAKNMMMLYGACFRALRKAAELSLRG
ncbi:MAG TPA: hypothetical protein DD727_04635 [Clostridiales bacterium]|nr:hypothetical protein [Clostridiales bacterium]